MSGATVLKTCFDVMHYSGATAMLRPVFAGRGVIFCLHRVHPGGGDEIGFSPNARLSIRPEFLDETIQLVRRLGYDLLSLPDAVNRLRRNADGRPFAVFTLDDGYRDNLLHAAPVFRKHGCPYAVFVAPRIADGTCEMWWLALEAMIAATPSLRVEIAGESMAFECRTDSQKVIAWNALKPLVQAMPEYAQREWVMRTASQLGVDVHAICRALAMGWDELRTMAADPLATIGAHTLNHYNLKKLPEADVRREMAESKSRIEAELKHPVRHFAYPYGNTDAAGPREFALAAETGYEASVTTRTSVVFDGHASHLQALPRIMVSGRFQKARYLETLISGVPSALMNRFQRVRVD